MRWWDSSRNNHFHYSAITTSLPRANGLITNEHQYNQVFSRFCQALDITRQYQLATHQLLIH
jgi:hypothetical protein